MSLITRCPACGTMFKVVPDQLRISEGWVRCGHCSEVFDARSHLQSGMLPPPASVPFHPEPLDPQPAAATPSSEAAGASISDEAARHQDNVSAVPPALTAGNAEYAPDAPISSGALLVNPESNRSSRHDEGRVETPIVQSDAPPLKTEDSQSISRADVADSVLSDEVSFVREARRKAFWHQPFIRTVLAVFSLVLVCGLVLQFAVHERDRLVAMEPQLKPWLVRLCMQLGCTVAVPRQIESVVIDSSTFNKVRGEVFRLSFTVKNTATLEVATPTVELTLTDIQDQVVVRRVLSPAELGAVSVLPPKGEWSAVLNLSVDSNGVASRISGYRLLAFYP